MYTCALENNQEGLRDRKTLKTATGERNTSMRVQKSLRKANSERAHRQAS
jgi:hypothetical protein